ncbi:hypothetical protein AFCDBAGC_2695 [Methylobacterium cerastii]|uniref:Integrase family protein n=1 Tax=Methylobacterium cerastii TaxID=932741 RepID=A0ABQ4QJA9_9HYPH|nr:integrase [Methylobacterium cerastii]GJD44826.1 hypothetical protein AFCDBAGC_2695 [Methylobacterium cerastii]
MTIEMPRPRPPFLLRETSRHGNVVWYVRRGAGPRIRLRAEYGSTAFWEEYRAAVDGRALVEPATPAPGAGTLKWLIERYMLHSAWTKDLSIATRGQRSGILKATVAIAGHEPVSAINKRSIQEGMERRREKPHGANNWLKTMRGLFAWAVEHGHATSDPTHAVKLLGGPNDRNGFHTWTEEEVARFEARWPLGTRERVALDVLLYTGLRRGDAARIGRPHLRNGVLRLATEKTSQDVSIRVLPALAATLAAGPVGDLTFIAGERGRPMTKESFGNWFREACRVPAFLAPPTACARRARGARRRRAPQRLS